MSTVYRPDQAPVPAPHEQAEPAKEPWLRRVPTPVFITVYGAVLIAIAVGAAMLVNYSMHEPDKAAALPQPVRPFNPAPADPTNVAESIRTYLIEDAEVGATHTGAMLRGTIASSAMAQPAELTGHLSRLLEQNCLDTVALTAPDGMRVNFWGFCFSTISGPTISTMIDVAEEEGADSVSFYNYADRGNRHEVTLNWFSAGSDDELDALAKRWRATEIPEDLVRINFTAYGDDNVILLEKDATSGNKFERYPELNSQG